MIEVKTGAENMVIDWENLIALEEGRGKPTSRIYMWSEPTISIGYSQEPREFSVPVVKRPTGGGALLHGWDISFSLVDYREKWGKSFTDIYRNFSEKLANALKAFDIHIEICKQKGGYGDHYFCFFFPTFGELTVGGRKFVACAMRTLREAFLIHGSIFINLDYERASEIIHVPKDRLMERLVCANEIGLSMEEILQALLKSL